MPAAFTHRVDFLLSREGDGHTSGFDRDGDRLDGGEADGRLDRGGAHARILHTDRSLTPETLVALSCGGPAISLCGHSGEIDIVTTAAMHV